MDMTYQFAWKEGKTVFYIDAFDYRYAAKNGNLSWRINNPGLVKHHCRYAKKNGSIGAWEKFAIFSNPQGHQALSEWLHSKTMLQCDLHGIAKHYQTSSPEQFVQSLAAASKISPKTKLKDLTQLEFDALLSSIQKLCGFSRVGSEKFYLLPKIAAKIECPDKEDLYLVGKDITLTREEAIQWIDSHVHERYTQERCKFYRSEFEKISNVTVVDPGSMWEHSFKNESYQNIVLEKIEKYRKSSARIALMDSQKLLVESFV